MVEQDARREGEARMSAQPVEHNAPDDLSELLDLIANAPDDGYRYEILSGELVVNPPATWRHEKLVHRLEKVILRALPSGWEIYGNSGYTVAGEHIVPDLAVLDSELPDVDQQWGEAPLQLVVEVESISTKRQDRLVKSQAYARQGIPAYWRVERSGVTHVHTRPRPDGTWDEVVTARPGESVTVKEPFEITLIPDEWI